jgi:hypothetical protein
MQRAEAFFFENCSPGLNFKVIPESFRFWPVLGPKEPAEFGKHGTFVRGLTRAYSVRRQDANIYFF